MISPFKAVIGGDYKVVERRLLSAIHIRFGLPAAAGRRDHPADQGRRPRRGLSGGDAARRLCGGRGKAPVRPRPRPAGGDRARLSDAVDRGQGREAIPRAIRRRCTGEYATSAVLSRPPHGPIIRQNSHPEEDTQDHNASRLFACRPSRNRHGDRRKPRPHRDGQCRTGAAPGLGARRPITSKYQWTTSPSIWTGSSRRPKTMSNGCWLSCVAGIAPRRWWCIAMPASAARPRAPLPRACLLNPHRDEVAIARQIRAASPIRTAQPADRRPRRQDARPRRTHAARARRDGPGQHDGRGPTVPRRARLMKQADAR